MKKQLAILFIGCTAYGTAYGAVADWWISEFASGGKICQIDNTRCYADKTPGIDLYSDDSWDISGNCRGKKFICADALSNGGYDAVAMERADIQRGTEINADFDTDVYVASENCYGARKTVKNGTMVLLNGKYVQVWCDGVLSGDTQNVANGQITTGPTPTCPELAKNYYVAVLNGDCYGKKYAPPEYAIDCVGDTPMIIVLNGADYDSNGHNTITSSMASTRFIAMQKSAATQRSIHFPK